MYASSVYQVHCMLADDADITGTANAYGVSLRTLRFYEEKGLLTPFRLGGTRLYRPKDRVRLEFILKGKRMGFSLIQIRKLLDKRKERDMPDLRNAEQAAIGSLFERLSKDQIQQQLQLLERQRDDLQDAIDTLHMAGELKTGGGP